MTLFKLIDFISSRRSSHIVNNTLLRAYPTLLYMIWTVLIVATLMSSIIFLTERGEFTVNNDFPQGAFLRPDILHSSKEESPFKSVLVSMYYVLVTMTSTGYGDLYCTSSLGRSLSNILMCSAVFILALPIAVLGNILSEEVDNYSKRKMDRYTVVEKQLRIGRKLPTYKYRRGPSFTGAKEIVGQTFRRLSAIAKPPSSPRQQHISVGPKTGMLALSLNKHFGNEEERPRSLGRRKSSIEKQGAGKSLKRGSDTGYDRRLSINTIEKIRKLSVSSLEFVETPKTHQPFETKYESSELNDFGEENGIVLNPIRSPNRSTSVTKLFKSSKPESSELSTRVQSPGGPSLPVIQQQISDIETQIEKYSDQYDEKMKECLEIYHHIQVQMKIRNELLKSLSSGE